MNYLRTIFALAVPLWLASPPRAQSGEERVHYEPTWESLDTHPTPEWLMDAKLGLFIYGPGLTRAEWEAHHKLHGHKPNVAPHILDHFPDHWAPRAWDQVPWNPEGLAQLAVDAGARYVVFSQGSFLLKHPSRYNDVEGSAFMRMGPKDRDYLGDVYRGRRPFREAFEAFLLSAGLSRGQIEEIEATCQARRRQQQSSVRPLPGVTTALLRLHGAGLLLGAIGNSEYPASHLRRRLTRFGIEGLFSTVISSIDLKRIMPEKACYLAAIEAMKLPADQVAFVGHDTAELAGAAAIGMPTIAFNFDRDAHADVYLARFEELVDVVCAPRPFAAA